MKNELNIVTRQETFNDLAVRELAEGRAACICSIQFGRCKKEECNTCPINKQYNNCYRQMTDYDKQRLAKYVSENYVRDSVSPQKWMTYRGLCLNTIKWFIIALFSLVLLFVPLAMLGAEQYPARMNEWRPYNAYGIDVALEQRIMKINKDVKRIVGDFDGNGQVNCIDHTVLWKHLWDEYYPDEKSRCTVIRIKNEHIHHLCIGLYDDYSKLVLVESQIGEDPRYFVRFWYETSFCDSDIIYGETARWLSGCWLGR